MAKPVDKLHQVRYNFYGILIYSSLQLFSDLIV